MDTHTIQTILKHICKCRKAQYDVLASNELDSFTIKRYPVCLIWNNKPLPHSGEHWLGVYIKCKYAYLEFFDSFGQGIKYYDKAFVKFAIKNNFRVKENNVRLQGISNLCGHYALQYIYMRLNEKSSNTFYARFGNDYSKNDNIVRNMFKNFILRKQKCKKYNQKCIINKY